MTGAARAMLRPKAVFIGDKPLDFIPAIGANDLPWLLGALAPDERYALARIAETADVLEVDGQAWLLVPADAALLDTLAAFGAEAEDRENDLDDEPGTDAEQVNESGVLDLATEVLLRATARRDDWPPLPQRRARAHWPHVYGTAVIDGELWQGHRVPDAPAREA